MIQFNLLPDVKIEYLKARQSRRLIIGIAGIVTVVSLALLISLLSAAAFQKKHLNDLSRNIESDSHTLQQKPQINKILTVQNQLQTIGALHDKKPAVTRLFDYLDQVTPAQVDITTLITDFTPGKNTLTITGNADALSTVNQYVDTLKFTSYSIGDKTTTKTPAFSNVVLTSFGVASAGTGAAAPTGSSAKASYNITLVFDPVLFNVTKTVKLNVPSVVTTRSELDQKNSDIFTKPAATTPTPAPATSTTIPTTGGSR